MIWLTLLMAATLIGALFYLNRRLANNTRELEAREAQVAKLRQRAGRVEDLIRCWLRASDNRALAQELYEVALEILDRISAIAPDQAFAANEQQRLLPIIEELGQSTGKRDHITTLASTNEVSRLQNEMKEIKRILRARQSSESITEGQYQQFCQDIDWVYCQVALDTGLSLAREAFQRDEPARASKLLKQAIATIEAADPSDARLEPYAETIHGLMKQLPPKAAAAE